LHNRVPVQLSERFFLMLMLNKEQFFSPLAMTALLF
jgi:hypothetical protein